MHMIFQVVEGDLVKLDKLSAHSLLFLGILFFCTKQLAPLYWCVPSRDSKIGTVPVFKTGKNWLVTFLLQ
jgi:hypothetical protein